MKKVPPITIIGGGLAGTEAAWQAAQQGLEVDLFEMRPLVSTKAHLTSDLAEIVCSNSLGSNLPNHASGLLKNELRRLDSLLIECADVAALPAGSALAVDREYFAKIATERILSHPNIKLSRMEMTKIPMGPVIIATGPLTSDLFAKAIAGLTEEKHLFFYDAIAPIITSGSINMDIAYRGSRFGVGEYKVGDYINCPFTQSEYCSFVNALVTAETIQLREFELEIEQGVTAGLKTYFEGCLPVEVLAKRGLNSLAFGPMRPIGLKDPRTGKGAHAVIQLRQDNLAANLYNLVGFQTNLTYLEQYRIFRMIPGLEKAEFVRYGQMHRNTFIASPKLLLATLQFYRRPDLFFAGQITGVEGYVGSIATGLLAGKNIARLIHGETPLPPPKYTMLGALCHYITHVDMDKFQPIKANFGILPPLPVHHKNKRDRARLFSERAVMSLEKYLEIVR